MSDSIAGYKFSNLDYRFNKHSFPKIALRLVAGFMVISGALLTTISVVLAPSLIIYTAIVTGYGGAMLGYAFSKKKHLADEWNISVKKQRF